MITLVLHELCFWPLKKKLLKNSLHFLKGLKKRVGHSFVCLRSNHGKEFENSSFIDYCNEHGIYPMSDEAIFLGYSSNSKAYKVFNKRTLCVEESVHMLFDETNSLVKNDAQDEEYKLCLTRRDLLLT